MNPKCEAQKDSGTVEIPWTPALSGQLLSSGENYSSLSPLVLQFIISKCGSWGSSFHWENVPPERWSENRASSPPCHVESRAFTSQLSPAPLFPVCYEHSSAFLMLLPASSVEKARTIYGRQAVGCLLIYTAALPQPCHKH